MKKASHNAQGFNPMGNHRTIPNVTSGEDVGKAYGPSKGKNKPKAYQSKIGPTIASGYLVSGTGDTRATGGPFTKANSAPSYKSGRMVGGKKKKAQ